MRHDYITQTHSHVYTEHEQLPHSQAFEGRKEGLLLTDARVQIIGYFPVKLN